MTDRRKAPQVLDDGGGIGLRQPGIGTPRHCGGENTTVWSNSRLDGRRDLLLGPIAEPCVVVGREIRSDEDAQIRHLEAHVRASKKPRHVRLPKKMTGRMAVRASGELNQVFAMRNLCTFGASTPRDCIPCRYRHDGQQDYRSSHVQPPNVVPIGRIALPIFSRSLVVQLPRPRCTQELA